MVFCCRAIKFIFLSATFSSALILFPINVNAIPVGDAYDIGQAEFQVSSGFNPRNEVTPFLDPSLQPGSNNNDSIVDSIMHNPDYCWSYKYNLDDDLVVITTAHEGATSSFETGQLPLALDPKFPESHKKFLKNLTSHSQIQGEKAMLKAMSIINPSINKE